MAEIFSLGNQIVTTDNLPGNGINLLDNTIKGSTVDNFEGPLSPKDNNDSTHSSQVVIIGNNGLDVADYFIKQNIELVPSTYTFSFSYQFGRTGVNGESRLFEFFMKYDDERVSLGVERFVIPSTKIFQKKSITFKLTKSGILSQIGVTSKKGLPSGNWNLCDFKLEIGSNSTSYTPSINDIWTRVSEIGGVTSPAICYARKGWSYFNSLEVA